MQRLSLQDIDQRLDQLIQGLQQDSRQSMSYSEAVFVVNTLYRTFGRNISEGVLSSVQQITDNSSSRRINKTELRTILGNAENNSINLTSNIQFVQPVETIQRPANVIRTEYREAQPVIYTSTKPQVITTTQIERLPVIETSSNNLTGTRRSITFRTTMNTVNGSSNIVSDSGNFTNVDSGIRVVRTSGYSKNLSNNSNNNYSQSAYYNNYQQDNGYVVDTTREIKHQKLADETNGGYRVITQYEDARGNYASDYNNDNSNVVLTKDIKLKDMREQLLISEVPRESENWNNNGEYRQQNEQNTVTYGNVERQTETYVEPAQQVIYKPEIARCSPYGPDPNAQQITKVEGNNTFTIRQGDYSVPVNPYLSNQSQERVIYSNNGVTYRRD